MSDVLDRVRGAAADLRSARQAEKVAMEARDAAIVEASLAGLDRAEIAASAGLTAPGIQKVIERAEAAAGLGPMGLRPRKDRR